jgi:ATP/maltotriose-dependent transcriptional regulator MalT
MEAALEHALLHAESGSRGEQLAIWNGMARAALAGPTPVEQAIERCRKIANEAPADRSLEAVLATISAYLEAMRGRFSVARELYASSQATLIELGKTVVLAALQTWSGAAELLAGDADAAEAELRAAFETLEPMGERANLSSNAAALAAALHMQGRDDEAAELTRLSERLASHDDFTSQVEWRAVRAKLVARQGQLGEAERLARESVSFAEQTDCPNLHGDALLSLGETLALAGQGTEACAAFAQAHDVYEAKGNTVLASVVAERSAAFASERAS